MIDVQQLRKYFGDHCAVNGVSFQVQPGEILGFLGPNGAGKSTTMKMLTGFLSPDSGSVSMYGESIKDNPMAVKAMLGYLPEGAPAYGDMTVRQFLQFIAEVRRGYGRNSSSKQVSVNAVNRQAVENALQALALDLVADQVIDTLSKGFKRRVGLAQAILHDPNVLILDEPTDGLDPNQKYQVRQLIQNLSRDKIVIISTHILEEVEALCSRAIIIKQGSIIFNGTPQELKQQSVQYQSVQFTLSTTVASDRLVEGLLTLPSVARVEVLDDSSEGSQQASAYRVYPHRRQTIVAEVSMWLQQQSLPLESLAVDEGRLDDVFRQLTTSLSVTEAEAMHGVVSRNIEEVAP